MKDGAENAAAHIITSSSQDPFVIRSPAAISSIEKIFSMEKSIITYLFSWKSFVLRDNMPSLVVVREVQSSGDAFTPLSDWRTYTIRECVPVCACVRVSALMNNGRRFPIDRSLMAKVLLSTIHLWDHSRLLFHSRSQNRIKTPPRHHSTPRSSSGGARMDRGVVCDHKKQGQMSKWAAE